MPSSLNGTKESRTDATSIPEIILTTNRITGSEDSRNLRIELNVHVPGIGHLLMSGIYLLIHPVRKWLAYLCVDDICHILARELEDLAVHSWQRFSDNRIACAEHQHVLDRKATELRYHDMLCLGTFDPPFFATRQIS